MTFDDNAVGFLHLLGYYLFAIKIFDLPVGFEHSIDEAVRAGLLKEGDVAVITAGVPLGRPGTTNLINVHVVGEEY